MILYIAKLFNIMLWASIIEFVGALVIVGYVLTSLLTLLRTRNVQLAKLQMATGAITALSFKLAGTLLKTISLLSWQQILMFVAIFALRTILTRLFNWEQTQLRQNQR